eukprot:symbB.v1.2.035367.t1/scaffold4743.1/size35524/5
MTWLMFELARHPQIQQKVQEEVDGFFASLNGRDPTYQDLSRFDLLDRCITETLRLWPAVANGTFRQLQFGEDLKGAGGRQVQLPRGTFVTISNWCRHRNPELWGADAESFNPWRDFSQEELLTQAGICALQLLHTLTGTHTPTILYTSEYAINAFPLYESTKKELARVGCPMAAATPQSKRFSPFAHNPRSCLGKNFAQMEMRLILSHILHRFDFSLAPPYDSLKDAAEVDRLKFRGVNRGGTMGPMDLERGGSVSPGERFLIAMKLHVKPRREG